MIAQRLHPPNWSDEERRKAADIYATMQRPGVEKKEIIEAICRAIGRNYWGVDAMLAKRGPRFGADDPRWATHAKQDHRVDSVSAQIPDRVQREQDYRINLEPRDLTAALMGDPLPGYSALDRQRGVIPFARMR